MTHCHWVKIKPVSFNRGCQSGSAGDGLVKKRLQWAITMGGYDSQMEKEGFSSSEFN